MNDDTHEDLATLYRVLLDEGRFTELAKLFFENTGQEIYDFILNRLNGQADVADDVYQTFAEEFVRGLPGCSQAPRAWAFRIAWCRITDVYEARKRGRLRPRFDSADANGVDITPLYSGQRFPVPGDLDTHKRPIVHTETESWMKTDFRTDVELAVAELPPEGQDLWWLRWSHRVGEGKADYRTIAEVLLGPDADAHDVARKVVALRKQYRRLKTKVEARVAELRDERKQAPSDPQPRTDDLGRERPEELQ